MDERKIIYIKPATATMLRYWLGTDAPSEAHLARPPKSCPYWFRKVGGQILRGFLRPLLEPPIFQQRPAFANFILFARDYLRLTNVPLLDDGKPFPDEWLDVVRTNARKLTYAHAWQKGDVLIADNSRFMHGRRAIADPAERRIATYFGYLKGIDRVRASRRIQCGGARPSCLPSYPKRPDAKRRPRLTFWRPAASCAARN